MSEENEEKKKVVLKVNFSKQGDMPSKKIESQMVTEWNYMRVAMAGVVMIILIAVGIYISRDEDKLVVAGNNRQGKQIIKDQIDSKPPPAKAADSVALKIKKQTVVLNQSAKKQTFRKSAVQIAGGLVRAQLARGIWKNEPFGNIHGTIKADGKEATGLFYFTELENMKGKAIYHIWKYKGEVIFKKKKDILDNHWRTYTSKLFTSRSIGPWSVEAVDSENRQLNIISFDVVAVQD